jgi:hypothetical protein
MLTQHRARTLIGQRERRRLTCMLVACALLSQLWSSAMLADDSGSIPADVVTLMNGDQISGVMTAASTAGVTLRPALLDPLSLAWHIIREAQVRHEIFLVARACSTCKAVDRIAMNNVTVRVAGEALQISGPGAPSRRVAVSDIVCIQTVSETGPCQAPAMSQAAGWTIAKLKAQGILLRATQQQDTIGGEADIVARWNPDAHGTAAQRTLVQLIGSYDSKRNATSTNITRDYSAHVLHSVFLAPGSTYLSALAELYHNNSLGIYFQQAYGVGAGRLLGHLELDGDVRFVGEHFYGSTRARSLVGSMLSERYALDLSFIAPGALLSETGRYLAVFNASAAWQAQGAVEIYLPVSRTIGITAGAFDTYVANAPAQFKKNYLKSSVGVQYSPLPGR